MAQTAVSNSSPLIFLRTIDRLDLLEYAFDEVRIASEVAREIRTVPHFVRVVEVANPTLVQALRQQMDLGEAATVALAAEMPEAIAIIDDRKGRRGAARLGVPTIGTLGLVADAKRSGRIRSAREIVDQLRRAGLFASDDVVRTVLESVGEFP